MASVTMKCCLKSCAGEVGPATGRVEVRGFQLPPGQGAQLKANWNESGEAVFHKGCWRLMCRALSGAPSGDQASDKTDLQLSDLEARLVQDAKKTAEFHDSDSELATEAKRIAQMIKQADYPVFFTGAGISTAAGIGDFRGKDGKWTERDKLKEHGKKGLKVGSRRTPMGALRPTYTHEAIKKLVEMGIFKYVISQNTDGLHRLSGVPASKISELHGNSFVHKCEKCKTRYDVTRSMRDMTKKELEAVPKKICDKCRINHRTGRKCEKKDCGGYLMNTIINFGDYLESHVLGAAEEHASRADVFVCLGSTLMVSPANSLVMSGRPPHRLVICNRQATEYDRECTRRDEKGIPIGSRVHGDCDRLMAKVMSELLDRESVREWEEGRQDRLRQYDEQRS